jgi:hypothetical protein
VRKNKTTQNKVSQNTIAQNINARNKIAQRKGVQGKGKFRVLFKKPSSFFPRARIIGRAFRNFTTQESRTFIVRFGGKRRFFRVPKNNPTKEHASSRYAWMKIFNILYPKVSVKPVGVSLMKRKVKGEVFTEYGVVSEIVRGLTPAYKQQQRAFYDFYDLPDAVFLTQGELSHIDFVYNVKNGLIKKIYAESGIRVDDHVVNVGNRKGSPVFFETALDPTQMERFKRFVSSQSPQKSKKIMELLEIIKKANNQ